MGSLRSRAGTLAAVGLAAIALAACGEDREEGSVEESGGSTSTTGTATTGTSTTGTGTTTNPSSGRAAAATIDVEETEFELDPKNPRIAKAGVVTFRVKNAGKVPHALEVEGPEGEAETGTIAPGESATLEANLSKAGTYVWYCPVGDHESRGMKGKIRVGSGASAGSKEGGSGKRGGAGGGSGGSGVY